MKLAIGCDSITAILGNLDWTSDRADKIEIKTILIHPDYEDQKLYHYISNYLYRAFEPQICSTKKANEYNKPQTFNCRYEFEKVDDYSYKS